MHRILISVVLTLSNKSQINKNKSPPRFISLSFLCFCPELRLYCHLFVSTPPASFMSFSMTPLLPTYLRSKMLNHMLILLGVEQQIPVNVGELGLRPWTFCLFSSFSSSAALDVCSTLAPLHGDVSESLLFYIRCCLYSRRVWHGNGLDEND